MSRARTSVCFAALVSIAALMAATDFEQLPTLRAGEILPASVAKGDRHQVEDEVKNVGYLNHYGIESDFGHFEAIGTARLIIRLREISALGELDELSNTEVFADAVLAGATQSAKVVASVAKHPVETIKGVPAGVGKLFGRTKRTVEAGYEAGKDLVTNDDEEDCEGEDCEGETCEGEDCGAEDAEDEDSRLDQAGVLATGYAEKYFGVSAGRRRWAQKLGVDPYSSNEVLIEAIEKVAKVDSAGRFSVKLAPIPRIPGARTLAKVNSLVFTMDAYELVQFNKKRLAEAGAEPEAIDAFYLNPFYSPTLQTILFTAFLSLEDAEGEGQALVQAGSAESVEQAQFFVVAAQMLQWFNLSESPVVRLLPAARTFVVETEDGRVVFHLPVDYLSWTSEVAETFHRLSAEAPDSKHELWVLGDVSDRCRAEMEGLGWTVRTQIGTQMRDAAAAAKAEAENSDG